MFVFAFHPRPLLRQVSSLPCGLATCSRGAKAAITVRSLRCASVQPPPPNYKAAPIIPKGNTTWVTGGGAVGHAILGEAHPGQLLPGSLTWPLYPWFGQSTHGLGRERIEEM